VIQETFMRVLSAIRGGQIRQPDRLGAFVNSVSKNVLIEHQRSYLRDQHQNIALDSVDVPDGEDLEGKMLQEERQKAVHEVLNKVSARDREILLMYYSHEHKQALEERQKLARDLGLPLQHLRVLVQRTRQQVVKALEMRESIRQKEKA